MVNKNTQKPNANYHHPHLPYATELVSYSSYGNKRRSCVALVGEGTGTLMAGMAQPTRSLQRHQGITSPSPPNERHKEEMRRAHRR